MRLEQSCCTITHPPPNTITKPPTTYVTVTIKNSTYLPPPRRTTPNGRLKHDTTTLLYQLTTSNIIYLVDGPKQFCTYNKSKRLEFACVQRYAINEAEDLFKEARTILEKEYGPYHPDTLGVYCNLVRTYDAMGRVDDAIEMLEYVVGMREENLGTANPDVDDEKCRLAELLKEAGRSRNRKSKRSLETLLDSNSQIIKDNCTSINVFNLYGNLKCFDSLCM
ncbi:protein KINESIN LIGHT CHAIN-RELATED 2-like [Medicago truncatula]|uniref:protein KINESIN LIGHT CHAIN-RELATED 2-like n=1 Tax=Medicago truncatula TaxID=3880 RepID=UPI0019685602|nr:protein KINESIN LIGHT CHAIN-RELATED 2-like [Medicago truncatula]